MATHGLFARVTFLLSLSISCLALVYSPFVSAQTWNSPHASQANHNIYYGAFTGAPKTLDPARAYTADEIQAIAQIYEPPLQYHYLKRPYTLIPLTAVAMPAVHYFNAQNQLLREPVDPEAVAYTLYDIVIKPGIFYHPHPAFAKDIKGHDLYLHLKPKDLVQIHHLDDFKQTATRELIAEDYIYAIKRLADPKIGCPIWEVMKEHIIGFGEYTHQLQTLSLPYDLRNYPMAGLSLVDRYHYQIKVLGIYRQFPYWLAMSFFAPVPWEVDRFYSQSGMSERNLTLDWEPVGTGPYQLTFNRPNWKMVFTRNPYFHTETYPKEGEPTDKTQGYLLNSGKRLPMIDTFDLVLEKESIPRWYKFLQGYYDASTISEDNFDQAIHLNPNQKPQVTPALKQKGIRLQTANAPSIFGIGFNMQDDVVGGYSRQKQSLRQAISIAVNYEEYIAIFMNGRGIPAQGPIPPGIFGYRTGKTGINSVVYDWQNGHLKRKSLAEAKRLLVEAGYPNGIDPKTKQALILNYDIPATNSPDESAQLNWFRKQFAQLGISLNVEATLFNRFLDKVRTGDVQLFFLGWSADYPDPENFLALLYGPNGEVKQGGVNAMNYSNPTVDSLYKNIAYLPNGSKRQQEIDTLLEIVRQESPAIWGMYPIDFTLSHQWTDPAKANPVASNTWKYQRLHPLLREELQKRWNRPIVWPLGLLFIFILILVVPLALTYWRRENSPSVQRFSDQNSSNSHKPWR